MKKILQLGIAIFALTLWASIASAQLKTNSKNIETGGGQILTTDDGTQGGSAGGSIYLGDGWLYTNGELRPRSIYFDSPAGKWIGMNGGSISMGGGQLNMDGGLLKTSDGSIEVWNGQVQLIGGSGDKLILGQNTNMSFQGGTNAGNISGVKDITASGTITCNALVETSDSRFKTNIRTLKQPLDLIKQVRGVRFDWNQASFPEKGFPSTAQIGFIAQEIESVFPEFVHQDVDGFKAVEYGKMTAILVEAVKEQQNIIEKQQQEIDLMKGQYTQLASRLEKLEDSNVINTSGTAEVVTEE